MELILCLWALGFSVPNCCCKAFYTGFVRECGWNTDQIVSELLSGSEKCLHVLGSQTDILFACLKTEPELFWWGELCFL